MFLLLAPLLLLLEVLNALGGSRKPYTGSLESLSYLPLALPFGPNWGHNKITDFALFGCILFITTLSVFPEPVFTGGLLTL